MNELTKVNIAQRIGLAEKDEQIDEFKAQVELLRESLSCLVESSINDNVALDVEHGIRSADEIRSDGDLPSEIIDAEIILNKTQQQCLADVRADAVQAFIKNGFSIVNKDVIIPFDGGVMIGIHNGSLSASRIEIATKG